MHFAMICCLSNHGAKIHIFFDTDALSQIFCFLSPSIVWLIE